MLVAAAAFGVLVAREPHWPVDAVDVASACVRALQQGDDTAALAVFQGTAG
jgi:hypothetical protein